MIVPLTPREIEFILAWRGRAFWPDEERVLNKLRVAMEKGEEPSLSRFQVQLVYEWVEEQLGGRYGGGRVQNPEEQAIVDKLRMALEGRSPEKRE